MELSDFTAGELCKGGRTDDNYQVYKTGYIIGVRSRNALTIRKK